MITDAPQRYIMNKSVKRALVVIAILFSLNLIKTAIYTDLCSDNELLKIDNPDTEFQECGFIFHFFNFGV